MVNVEVPKERVDFFKIFSTLLNMGSNSKKEKDAKGVKEKMSYRRQISSEQELWQERYKDYLWLELQMEKNGFQNQLEQEEFLQNERAKIPGVIEEILNFRFECSVELSDSKSEEDSYANRQNEGTAYSFTLSSETVAQQREALKYVQELLDKLDSCEKLFPTSRSFAKEYEMYKNEQFTQRVKSLYLWQSITKDLCHKIKKLGLVLGAQHASDLDWPVIESPRSSEEFDFTGLNRVDIPKIQESVSGNSEDEVEIPSPECLGAQTDNAKRVTFTLHPSRASKISSPDSSEIPSRGSKLSSTYSLGSLSRASSEASLDELHHTSAKLLFRKYVDKTLKRMGMNKMLLRFKELLDRTLQRAREALQRPKTLPQLEMQSPEVDGTVQLSSSPSLDLHYADASSTSINFHRSSSLTDFGAWCEQFIQMGLPSFQSSYLFPLHVFLESFMKPCGFAWSRDLLSTPRFSA